MTGATINTFPSAVLLLGLGIAVSGCASPPAAPPPQSVEVLPQWHQFVQNNYQDEVKSRLHTPEKAEILHSPLGIGCIYYPAKDYTSLFAVVPVIPNAYGQRIRQDMIIRWWAPGNATGDPSAPWKSDRWGVPPPEERNKERKRSE